VQAFCELAKGAVANADPLHPAVVTTMALQGLSLALR